MAKDSNIVHRYFRKQSDDCMVLIKVNPILFTGTEITVPATGQLQVHEVELDEEFETRLVADGYKPAGPMEFHLYFSGLSGV